MDEKNFDLLNETVNGLEGKFTNPLFRAYIGYRNLDFKNIYLCMKQSAEFLHHYCGKVPISTPETEDAFWKEICEDVDRRIMEISNEDEGNRFLKDYATNVFLECITLLEAEKQKKQNNSI